MTNVATNSELVFWLVLLALTLLVLIVGSVVANHLYHDYGSIDLESFNRHYN